MIDARGDYLVFVKDTQPTLRRDIQMAFAPPAEGAFAPRQQRIWDDAMDTVTTLDKGHGRRERRTMTATTAMNEYLDWPGVAQVGQVESEVVKAGKTTPRNPLLRRQCLEGGGGRGSVAHMGPRTLVDRESFSLRT